MFNTSQMSSVSTKPKFAIQIENWKMVMNDGWIWSKLQKTKYTPNLYSPTLAKATTPAWAEKKPMSVAPVKEPVAPAWVQKAPMSVAPVKQTVKPTEQVKPQTDFLNELDYDIKNGATVQEITKAYPELKNNTKLINELHYDVNNGATIDEIKQAYPELWMQDINKLWLWEELVARAKNIWWDIADRFWDIKESFTREKSDNPLGSSAQSLWTWLKTAWSIIWAWFDVVWEWIGFVTPDIVKNALTGAGKKIWETTPDTVKEKTVSAIQQWWEVYSKFKKENPFLADALEWSWNIASLLPIWKWAQVVPKLAPAFKSSWEVIAKWWELVKSKIITPKNLEKEVWKVIQWETKNIKPAIETLKIVDTKWVKTYNDLLWKVWEKQKNIVALQDNLLQKETWKYWVKNTNKQIQTALWEKQVNYVKNSLDDIKREIETVWDFESYNKKLLWKDKTLWDTIKRIEDWDASLEDLNDIARYYNSEFRDKIYTTQWVPKNSEVAWKYETNRKWIKEFVREQLSTKELKDLDLQYSNIAETKKLISKINEWVNKLEQKFKDRWIGYKIVSWTLKVADTISLWWVRALKNYFITSNIWSKINNLMDIQNDLSKNLKTIEKLLNKKDLNKTDLLNLNNNLPKNANITNSNIFNTIKNSETSKWYLWWTKEVKPSILSPREKAKISGENKITKK